MTRAIVVAVMLAVVGCGGPESDPACYRVQMPDPTRILLEFRSAGGELLGHCDLGNPVHPLRVCWNGAGEEVSPSAFAGCVSPP